MWKSRESHGHAFLRQMASLVAVEITMELSKVAIETYEILPARGPTQRLIIGG